MYLSSPTHRKSYHKSSPIASKEKTPSQKRKTKPYRLTLNDDDHISKKSRISSINDLSASTKIFSPKYLDTTLHSANNAFSKSPLNSPPASPIKQTVLDRECRSSVKSMRESLWNSVQDEMDGLLFMKYAPTLPTNYFDRRKPVLPPQKRQHQGRYTLVLDLDETLVHCSIDKMDECDLIFPVIFNGESYNVHMKKRPCFKAFLEFASKNFEVVIFTASQQCYADKLLNLVDPQKKYIHYRLFRQHCINVEGNYVKDLRVLGRDLSKTMIIDNSTAAFTYQIDNGIPIVSWYDDKDDTELLKVIPVLTKLSLANDVRISIKKYFKIKKLLKTLKA